MSQSNSGRAGMTRWRRAEIARARLETTAADDRGARWLVGLVLVQADEPAGWKMLQCGQPNPNSTGQVHCYLPACPVCSHRRGWRWFVDRLQPAMETVPASQCRFVTVLLPPCDDLDQVMP